MKIKKIILEKWIDPALITHHLTKKDKIFYVQPAWNNANGFSLAIDFVKNNPDWKLSLQTHKYLKIK